MFELSLAEETDLNVPIDNEAWMIRFLRPTKFYPESALQLVSRPTCRFNHKIQACCVICPKFARVVNM